MCIKGGPVCDTCEGIAGDNVREWTVVAALGRPDTSQAHSADCDPRVATRRGASSTHLTMLLQGIAVLSAVLSA